MINAGEIGLDGHFSADQLDGEPLADLIKIVESWDRPRPAWPEGTTFSPPHKSRHWSSDTTWARTPSGVSYELLLSRRDGDPTEAPPVMWAITVDRYGQILAHPRIANMHVTFDLPHPVSEERRRDGSAGVPVGLARCYEIGRLPRGLRERMVTVSDGWGY